MRDNGITRKLKRSCEFSGFGYHSRALLTLSVKNAATSLSGHEKIAHLRELFCCFWCPEESRSRRRDPGIRSTEFPSSPVAKHAGVSLSGHKKIAHFRELFCFFWCPEEDSNLHTLRHTDLNRARLPIPPSGQAMNLAEGKHFNSMRKICQ